MFSLKNLSNHLFIQNVYKVMEDFHTYNLLLSCSPLNILDISPLSLNHNISFEKLLEILLNNDLVFPVHMVVRKVNNHSEVTGRI